ncbi:PITH domain-containing protein At3g04780 [Asparagus officinalis]|uniref:PITH domain-containing protein At3g04780 n=1 Tax=Asparagus officinalis TaxID=4686 RepID=UPI00098E29D2|nr:PITH domain-containing protein At3g04780 [Asparagus officinalis]
MAASVASSTIQRGQVDLIDFIDWRGIECLNHNSSHALANALKQGYRDDDGLHLESDADEQLLIYIPFTQVVKLHSIVIKGPEEEGPKTVKLFANKENMGFSNVNDYPPSDSIVLSPETLEVIPVTLKYVKFQNVRSLTIFIEDNQGGDEITKVQKILLYGTTVDTTNMKDLKKVEEH